MLLVPVNIIRTHSLATGYNTSFYQDSTTSSLPQQEAAVHPPVAAYSPVPAFPQYPPVTRQTPTTHLSRSVSSIRRRRYAAQINPGQHPYARPQAVPNSGSLDFDFTSAGEFSLPTASSSRTQSDEECKSTPFRYLI